MCYATSAATSNAHAETIEAGESDITAVAAVVHANPLHSAAAMVQTGTSSSVVDAATDANSADQSVDSMMLHVVRRVSLWCLTVSVDRECRVMLFYECVYGESL